MFLNIATAVLAVFAFLRVKDIADGKKDDKSTATPAPAAPVSPATKDAIVKGDSMADTVINKKIIPADLNTHQMNAVMSRSVNNPLTVVKSSNMLVNTATAQKLV